METLLKDIEGHYFKDGLYEEILSRLKALGKDLSGIRRSDIEGVDEFHVRGAAVSKELAQTMDLRGLQVLDVGCGIGGACRMLAEAFQCQVTGVDLSHEFIRTATALSKLVKLDEKTTFMVANAMELPFEDQTFDVVWTQHVQMNVPEKERFYSEIERVLRPKGHFLYYDIFKGNDDKVSYPMPWASSADYSFLFKVDGMAAILRELNLRKIATTDQTEAGIAFFETLMAKLEKSGPPKMGLNVLMGKSTVPKLLNLLEHLKSGALMLESGSYQKE